MVVMRECGDCTACCKLVPVRELGKPANQRCVHQRHGGCKVYRKAGFPVSCGMWSCRWLINDDAGDLRRPDRSHYVIDSMPDYVVVTDNTTGEATKVPVIQIWCDPSHRDAHRDPALRAWIERKQAFALVRYGNAEGMMLMPPAMNSTGRWLELTSNLTAEPEHSFDDILQTITELQDDNAVMSLAAPNQPTANNGE